MDVHGQHRQGNYMLKAHPPSVEAVLAIVSSAISISPLHRGIRRDVGVVVLEYAAAAAARLALARRLRHASGFAIDTGTARCLPIKAAERTQALIWRLP